MVNNKFKHYVNRNVFKNSFHRCKYYETEWKARLPNVNCPSHKLLLCENGVHPSSFDKEHVALHYCLGTVRHSFVTPSHLCVTRVDTESERVYPYQEHLGLSDSLIDKKVNISQIPFEGKRNVYSNLPFDKCMVKHDMSCLGLKSSNSITKDDFNHSLEEYYESSVHKPNLSLGVDHCHDISSHPCSTVPSVKEVWYRSFMVSANHSGSQQNAESLFVIPSEHTNWTQEFDLNIPVLSPLSSNTSDDDVAIGLATWNDFQEIRNKPPEVTVDVEIPEPNDVLLDLLPNVHPVKVSSTLILDDVVVSNKTSASNVAQGSDISFMAFENDSILNPSRIMVSPNHIANRQIFPENGRIVNNPETAVSGMNVPLRAGSIVLAVVDECGSLVPLPLKPEVSLVNLSTASSNGNLLTSVINHTNPNDANGNVIFPPVHSRQAEDEEIDVETVSDRTPVLQASDLATLLAEFEASERVNMKTFANNEINPVTLSKKEIPPKKTIKKTKCYKKITQEIIQKLKACPKYKRLKVLIEPVNTFKRKHCIKTRRRNNFSLKNKRRKTKWNPAVARFSSKKVYDKSKESVHIDHDYCFSQKSEVNNCKDKLSPEISFNKLPGYVTVTSCLSNSTTPSCDTMFQKDNEYDSRWTNEINAEGRLSDTTVQDIKPILNVSNGQDDDDKILNKLPAYVTDHVVTKEEPGLMDLKADKNPEWTCESSKTKKKLNLSEYRLRSKHSNSASSILSDDQVKKKEYPTDVEALKLENKPNLAVVIVNTKEEKVNNEPNPTTQQTLSDENLTPPSNSTDKLTNDIKLENGIILEENKPNSNLQSLISSLPLSKMPSNSLGRSLIYPRKKEILTPEKMCVINISSSESSIMSTSSSSPDSNSDSDSYRQRRKSIRQGEYSKRRLWASRSRSSSRSRNRSNRHRGYNSPRLSHRKSSRRWPSRGRSRSTSSFRSRSYSESSSSSSRSRSRERSRFYRNRNSRSIRDRWRSRSRSSSLCRYSRRRERSKTPNWYSSRHHSPYPSPPSYKRHRTSSEEYWREQDERRGRREERNVVYVGSLDEYATKENLRSRFRQFGRIINVTIHKREIGSDYGFVTYKYHDDAYEAIEHGNDDISQPQYNLCFGGRRAFCKSLYSDLDSNQNEIEEDAFHRNHVSTIAPVSDPTDYTCLLQSELRRRR